MRVLWVVGTRLEAFGPTPDATDLAVSVVASERLRMAVPAAALRQAGVHGDFYGPGDRDDPFPDLARYAAVVLGKFATGAESDPLRAERWLRLARRAREAGCKVVADVSDNPFFQRGLRADLYADLLPACHAVTVPSEAMARELAGHGPAARIIEDPFEGAPGEARFAPSGPLRLLWFGHKVNFVYLERVLPGIEQISRTRPIRLHVLTANLKGLDGMVAEVRARFSPAFEMSHEPWSVAATGRALEACDLVVVPSDPSDPRKRGASANRVTESLAAGRLPVASPLDAYRPYAEGALLREDVAAGVEEALARPAEMLERIRRGQRLVEERCSPAAVAAGWRGILG